MVNYLQFYYLLLEVGARSECRSSCAGGMDLETSCLSDLPRLEGLAFNGSDKQMKSLIIWPEDLSKFPAVNLISGLYH